ncbi:SGNH hydrolase-type esterase domain-containing protein [Cadophora sp. MPI-SDFR-AT-0126]|nr:SGNH hydrolase-type esterase domain-containing protein [Leotiomycetes sp. MPI-SDFR-AT-0126]
MSQQTSPKPLHVLCFGDSLTEGYSMYGMQWTPYSETLQTRLDEQLGNEWKVNIDTDGVSGQLVTAGFRKRMEGLYGVKRTRESPYDWVIFLGGTNDLAYSLSPTKIHDEIKAITALPLETGAKVLLMTVPECGVKNKKLDERRNELNSLIKGDERDGVYTLDLHALIPFHAMPEAERDEIWDDGLHFTPEGYQRVGLLVADRLIELLAGDKKAAEDGKDTGDVRSPRNADGKA